MMIQIELPDWVNERQILILAGTELAAKKMPWEKEWTIKDDRCNRCGDCCRDLPENGGRHGNVTKVKNGVCEYLQLEPGTTDKYNCSIAGNRPLCCLLDPLNKLNCNITYK